MRLDRLVAGEALSSPDAASVEVTGITHDTRRMSPGSLFACVPGQKVDGHDLAARAVSLGAVALLVERPVESPVPQVQVPSVRAALGPLASRLHGDPSRSLTVVGVTGTNGKTTTTHLLKAIFDAAGIGCGLIGTMSGARTTPEAVELQGLLAEFRDGGLGAVAMEVSSPALVAHRVDGTWFAAAVFTNLGRDHLEVHGTVEAYFEAKASLFRPELAGAAVVNLDDPWGRRLADRLTVPLHPFSMADAAELELGPRSSRFRWRGHAIDLGMAGDFNVANALAAATAAVAVGIDPATAAEGLSAAPVVTGHFEMVDAGQPFSVVVDYAHTPDALVAALRSARALAGEGRVIAVFGCGGDRDPGKRPEMGAAVAAAADVAVLTSDNPRSEDPEDILDQVQAGMTGGQAEAVRLTDREKAIAEALRRAQPGDVVLIAGKGHETGQEIGDRVIPFDDRAVAVRLLGALA